MPKKPHISKKAKQLIRDLQSEMIDCGMESFRTYGEMRNSWDDDPTCVLLVSAFDVDGKFHTWREGDDG